MSDAKNPPILCIFTAPSDAAMKQFTAATKGCLPPNVHVVGLKAAVDLAVKSKPPLIPAPQPDVFSLSGDLLPLVITNYVATQGRKPPPKQAARKPPRRGKGATQESKPTTPQTPEKPEPSIALVTDFPRSPAQAESLLSCAFPAICWIMLEGPPEPEKKGGVATPPPDWRELFSRDIPFFTYNFAEGNAEETIHRMINDIFSSKNAFEAYRTEFEDVRFVDIPKFPREPMSIPQFVPEKTAKLPKGAPPPAPVVVVDAQEALRAAYEQAVLAQLDECIAKASMPSFSTHFQHSAELLPEYALPASLAVVLSHVAEKRTPELFTMRSVAFRTGISYQAIYSAMMIKKFEEMIGFSVGERRHIEQLPLDFVPNVLVPLIGEYSMFKWCDFAGVTLLAFYHGIPQNMPISEVGETFKLPLFTGFGKWLEGREPFDPKIEDAVPRTEAGVNAGGKDLFCGFDSDETTATVSHYFCESGLRVDTYPAKIANGIVESLSFYVDYQGASQFSFNLSQKAIPPTNPEEEEEEDNIETAVKIRGVLARGCECFLDHSPSKKSFVVLDNTARIEFDISKERLVITGAPEESHRVITSSGDMIRYAGHPIVYKKDGVIEHFIKGAWYMTDKDGKAYVKKDGQWFLDPVHDLTQETFETYFTDRKVVKRSDGLTFISDDNESSVCFPDGTKFANNATGGVWSRQGLPDIRIGDGNISVQGKIFTATFDMDHVCSLELKNETCHVAYDESIGNVMITFGQSKGAATLVDLVNGAVANIGTKRFVYFLNDEREWVVGRQLCSKKDFIQHFKDGEFQDRLELTSQIEANDIESIICKGQRPRLFVVERDQNAMTVKELLAAPVFQAVMEQSTTRVANKDDCNVTLWFDTEPSSYREIRITPKLTEDQKTQIFREMENEKAIEDERTAVLESVGDPKWRELEEEQRKEEEKMLKLLEKYNNPERTATASSEADAVSHGQEEEAVNEEEVADEQEPATENV